MNLTQRDIEILEEATQHSGDCRCEMCLEWWRLCGEDDGKPGNFGPFTKEEIEAAGGLR